MIEISSHKIPFLDLFIYIKEGKLNTRLFTNWQTYVSEQSFRTLTKSKKVNTLLRISQTKKNIESQYPLEAQTLK